MVERLFLVAHEEADAPGKPGGRVVLLDSFTHLDPRVGLRDVVVAGSFAGTMPVGVALEHGVRATISHAAGVGLDGAGIGGLDLADKWSVPAAAAETMSARMGDGRRMHGEGRIGHANRTAEGLGVKVGLAVAEAARRMLAAPPGRSIPAGALVDRRHRVVVESPEGRIVLMGSSSFAGPQNRGDVIVLSSHASYPPAEPLITVGARGGIFNDGGLAKDRSAVDGLPMLDAAGIPGAAVAAMSARMGDPLSTWQQGVVSVVNDAARGLGVEVGQSAQEAARRMLGAPRR